MNDGIIVRDGLEYFTHGEVVPSSVMWCVHPKRGTPVWTRQLCTAINLLNTKGAKKTPKERQLGLFDWNT
jgi:hypothetical protein